MTVQEVVLDSLAYANVFGFELGGADEDEGEVVKAIAGVNQAIEIIYRDGPLSLKYDARSAYLNAPTAITLTFTQGAKTATMTGNFVPWMRGCSIMVDGDGVLNRIVDIVFAAGTSTFTFLRAYTGVTGSHAGTVYADCVLLDSDVVNVIEPVTLAPNCRLRPAQSKADFTATRYWSGWVGPNGQGYVPFFTTWEKIVGTPQEYRVEQRMDTANVGGSLYLGLNPMPTVAGNVNFDVYRKPVLIDRDADLDEDGGDDPAVPIKALPADMIESYLLPIARWKYVAAHPNVQNREVRGSLKSEYDEAILRLRTGESLNPQINMTRARYL
jgi:hypothetical protein